MKTFLIVFFASYLPYILLVIAIALFFIKEKNWRQRLYVFSVFALAAILSRGLITEIIRFFYYRPRPFLILNTSPLINHDISSSFPSGHMTFYFVLALTIFFLLSRKWGCFFIISVISTGLARVLAGVHWYSDIIAGIAIAILCYFFVQKILPFKKPLN
jgi:undecaprenyl-diphosphatase